MTNRLILNAKDGYNLIAPFYDTWKWQEFWRCNEHPFIEKWCNSLEIGSGADLGAGSGNNLACFLRRHHHVTAYDISELMLLTCQQKYRKEIAEGLLECYVRDINDLSVGQRSFDWMLCNRVLSHISDANNVIRRMARLLRQGGQCFISDVHPLHHYDYTHFDIGGREIVIETYKHGMNDLKDIIYINGLSIIDFREITKPMLIDPDMAVNHHSIKDDNTPIFYYMILRKI